MRFVGVTSHCPDHVNAYIQTGEVDTAMFFVNPVFPYSAREVIPHAKARNVGTIAMRPLDHAMIKPVDKAMLWTLHSGVDVVINGIYTMAEAEQNVAIANAKPSEEELRDVREAFARVPEHNCHNCFLCKCPFNIPVARFATYLEWRKAFGIADDLEETLKKAAVRAKDYYAFCESCHLCEAQCPYDVPLVDFVRQAVEELG